MTIIEISMGLRSDPPRTNENRQMCTHTNFVHTQCKIVHTKIWSEVLFKLLFPVPPQLKLFVHTNHINTGIWMCCFR